METKTKIAQTKQISLYLKFY